MQVQHLFSDCMYWRLQKYLRFMKKKKKKVLQTPVVMWFCHKTLHSIQWLHLFPLSWNELKSLYKQQLFFPPRKYLVVEKNLQKTIQMQITMDPHNKVSSFSWSSGLQLHTNFSLCRLIKWRILNYFSSKIVLSVAKNIRLDRERDTLLCYTLQGE